MLQLTLALKKQSFLIGVLLLGFVGYIFCFNTLLFFLNISMSFQTALISFISYFLISRLLFNKSEILVDPKLFYSVLGWALFFIIISLWVSYCFYDYSYDGQTYHGEAIIQFANGWNPNVHYLPGDGIIPLVVNHFAKASWVNGAFFYLLTGNFEMAKATNIILIFSNFLIAWPFFLNFLKPKLAVLFSLLIALNPITLNMYLSNMLDSQVANLVFIFFILLIERATSLRKIPVFVFATPVIYALNLKFTWVGFYAVFIFFISIYILFTGQFKQQWKFVFTLGLFYLAGVLIFGYNTYVRNTLEFEHPFYPFKGKANIGQHTTVDALDYREGNKILNFAKSQFASTTFSEAYTKPLQYKWPFTVSKYEIERYAFAGVMIGGFGVWYSVVVLLSILLLLWLTVKKVGGNQKLLTLYFIIVMIMASVLINPLSYIARYNPQYYLIPIIILMFYIKYANTSKWFLNFFIVVMAINSIFIMGYTAYNIVVTKKIQHQVEVLKKAKAPVMVNFGIQTAKRALFNDNRIKFIEVKNFQNIKPDTIFRSEVTYHITE